MAMNVNIVPKTSKGKTAWHFNSLGEEPNNIAEFNVNEVARRHFDRPFPQDPIYFARLGFNCRQQRAQHNWPNVAPFSY